MALTDQNQWMGLGCAITGTSTVVSVLNAATLLSAANTDRTTLIIQNQGSEAVYLGYDDSVSTLIHFLKLNPGAAYEINATNMYVGDIYSIAATGPVNVSVGETES